MSDLPSYVWVLVMVGVIGIPGTTCVVLYQGAVAAGCDRRKALVVAAVAGIAMGGWIVASGLLAAVGAYRQGPAVTIPWLGVALVGALVAALLAARIPIVSRILADPGTAARLALPEMFRGVGATFLVVLALGQLPAVFALPAGLGDLAVGIAAPFVARRLRRGVAGRGAVWFNVLGIVDLVVAVATGFLTSEGPAQVLPAWPTSSSAAIALLPLALIPTTAVPLAAALHLVSLRKLRTDARAAALNGQPATAR